MNERSGSQADIGQSPEARRFSGAKRTLAGPASEVRLWPRADIGPASNIIAQDCLVDWHFGAMPTDEPQEIVDHALAYLDDWRKRMQAHRKEADITTTQRASVPPLKPDDASPATSLALALTGSNDTAKASFATEAGLFQGDGIAAVVCGPGSIAQAHQPDEFITLAQVEAGTAFVRRLIERVRG